jgi:tetratricopeptide (TPR) repeat protein
MVTRLDGPTPEIARGLVDKALEAESRGLWGHAYIDLRAITNGPYWWGDRMITNAAVAAKRLGFETFVDNQPASLGVGYPLSQVALYVGWYDSGVTGPFYRASVEFLPGAFAYHLHSFSAANLRSASENWVGPLLARGATATMGCVAEPYLEFTPNPAMFLERWGYVGMTLGEAATAAHPVLSWQTVVVGDPLYRPFGRLLADDGKRLDAANDPSTAYALVRNANLQVMAGRPVEAVRDQLEGQRWATNHAVVAEKIGRLYWSGIRVRRALEWYDTALGLTNATPMQRRRLLLDSIEAHRVLGQPAEAYRCLEQLIVTSPPDVDRHELRIRQLQFARDMRDVEKITSVSNEVQRLGGQR